jgi:hypothetical protein
MKEKDKKRLMELIERNRTSNEQIELQQLIKIACAENNTNVKFNDEE